MAKPSLTPYSTGYPVKTGASVGIGGYADITLLAHHQCGTRRLVGGAHAFIDGGNYLIEPVITWADAETGWYYYDDESGGTNIPDDATWRNWNAGGGYTRKNIQLCWKLEIVEPAVDARGAKHTFVLIPILTGELDGGSGYYDLPSSFSTQIGEFDIKTSYAIEQRVNIAEEDNTTGQWTNFPTGAKEEGMGLLQASFTREWDETVAGTLTVNGVNYTLAATSGAGTATAELSEVWPDPWYPAQLVYWLTGGGIIQNPWPADGTSGNYPMVQLGEAVIGTSAASYKLPHDGDGLTDKRYRLWDKWNGSFAEDDDGDYSFEVIGEGNTLELWACGYGGGAAELAFAKLEWITPPYVYCFQGTVEYLDGGGAPAATPEFEDISSPFTADGQTWTGLNSPTFRGGGTWALSGTSERTGGRLLADPPWATYADETGDANGLPDEDPEAVISGVGGTCSYEVTEVPAAWATPYFSLKLTNPTAFGGYADGTRVLLRYPRNKSVLTIAAGDAVTVDEFDSADWSGSDCTVTAEPGGGIRVTDVVTGAYIYRTYPNKAEGPPAVDPTYWPGHRYAKLAVTCYEEGTETETDFIGSLKLGGRSIADDGDITTWTRTHSHRLRDEYFDLCRPDELNLPNADLEQSWITQALPMQSWDRYGEKTLMSWSWGPGAINRVEVCGLQAGIDYVFTAAQAVQLTAKLDTTTLAGRARAMCLTAHEYAGKRMLGWTGSTLSEDEESLERILSYVVNGRTAFESGSVHEEIAWVGEEGTCGRYNYSIQGIDDGTNRWPADTFAGLTIADLLPWDDDWWDGTNEVFVDEDVLFCPEVTPAWFLEDGVQAESTGSGLATLTARPLFDWISPDLFYGDGGDTETPGKFIFKYKIIVGNRLHGMMWQDMETGEEAEVDETFDYSLDNPASSEESSEIGSYDSAVQLNPTDLTFETKVESGIPLIRPNSWTRCCLYITVSVSGAGIDAAIHPLTGIGFVAWTEEGSVWVARTTTYGKTFDTPVEAVASGVAPCLATASAAEHHWALAWESGGDVKIAWTTDGFVTLGEVSDVMSASHYSRILGNPLTSALMVVAWKDGGDLVSRISRDYGKTFGAEVVVASDVPEQAFGLALATDPRDIWTVVWMDALGDIQTYWSANDGAEWHESSTV